MSFENGPAVKPEKEIEAFEQKAELLVNTILDDLEQLYPHAEYEYHNMRHSQNVGEMAAEMLESDDKRKLVFTRLIGSAHDYSQEYQDPWPTRGEGKVGYKRVRKTGAIEERSLEILLQKCQEAGLVLTEEEKNIASEAIRATIPGWSMEDSTVTQPQLTEGADDITFAIAAADIASSGYNPEHFLKDGDNVFNEDNLLPLPETLTDEEAEQLLQEALGWSALQIKYAAGQKKLWDREFVPEFAKRKLTRFDESIELCEKRYEDRLVLVSQGPTPQEKLRLLLDDMNFKRYIQS